MKKLTTDHSYNIALARKRNALNALLRKVQIILYNNKLFFVNPVI